MPESSAIPLSSNISNTNIQNLLQNNNNNNNNNLQRKTRVRKHSKSPDNNCSNTSIIGGGNTTFSTGTIVNINLNSSSSSASSKITSNTTAGSVTTAASAGGITPGSTTNFKTVHHQDHIVDSISSSDNIVTKAKISKTEVQSNNGNGVVAPGAAIVTQIVVARDNKEKNMTSLGMGMVI